MCTVARQFQFAFLLPENLVTLVNCDFVPLVCARQLIVFVPLKLFTLNLLQTLFLFNYLKLFDCSVHGRLYCAYHTCNFNSFVEENLNRKTNEANVLIRKEIFPFDISSIHTFINWYLMTGTGFCCCEYVYLMWAMYGTVCVFRLSFRAYNFIFVFFFSVSQFNIKFV